MHERRRPCLGLLQCCGLCYTYVGCNDPAFEEPCLGFPLFEIWHVDPDTINIRGYRFEGRGKPLNLSILPQEIEAILDALQIPNAHAVIGSGLGGTTAMTFAIQNPDRQDKFHRE